jgi:hypothetical protein
MGQVIYGQIMAVLLFFVSVLNKFLSVYVSFSCLNFDSPAAGLYSWYDGFQNLSLYHDRNVEFDSTSSVVVRSFMVNAPSLLTRCDKRLCLTSGQSVYKPYRCRSVLSMLTEMLLIIGGIEINPDPNFDSNLINYGLLNGQAVGRKAAFVLDIIADHSSTF